MYARDFPRTINHRTLRDLGEFSAGEGGSGAGWGKKKKREAFGNAGINDPLKIIPAYSTGVSTCALHCPEMSVHRSKSSASAALLHWQSNNRRGIIKRHV